jgi:hypothetical protein
MFLFKLKYCKNPLASDESISEFPSKLNDHNQLFLLPFATTGTIVSLEL